MRSDWLAARAGGSDFDVVVSIVDGVPESSESTFDDDVIGSGVVRSDRLVALAGPASDGGLVGRARGALVMTSLSDDERVLCGAEGAVMEGGVTSVGDSSLGQVWSGSPSGGDAFGGASGARLAMRSVGR